mmetsp:Transcript_18386/g.42131  ORF Transcript_18386/g.42131 Transcript_18386/m.42131 type:complete len:258 (-) Transcript_18386:398-1171(-)
MAASLALYGLSSRRRRRRRRCRPARRLSSIGPSRRARPLLNRSAWSISFPPTCFMGWSSKTTRCSPRCTSSSSPSAATSCIAPSRPTGRTSRRRSRRGLARSRTSRHLCRRPCAKPSCRRSSGGPSSRTVRISSDAFRTSGCWRTPLCCTHRRAREVGTPTFCTAAWVFWQPCFAAITSACCLLASSRAGSTQATLTPAPVISPPRAPSAVGTLSASRLALRCCMGSTSPSSGTQRCWPLSSGLLRWRRWPSSQECR